MLQFFLFALKKNIVALFLQWFSQKSERNLFVLEFVQLFCGLSGSGFMFKLMPIHGHGDLY